MRFLLVFLLVAPLLCGLTACNDQAPQPLTILAGRGLKKPMEEIRAAFINKYGIAVHIVYGGSGTLLATIKRSHKGDVYIPGSLHTMDKAGDMIVRHVPVALHIPALALSTHNQKQISSFADLIKPGIRIGIAHKEMAAIGRTSEEIIDASPYAEQIMANIIIKTQNVTVLLDHLVNDELDAAFLWSDMMLWPEAKGITSLAIPPEFNKVKQIHAGLLRHSTFPKEAGLFVDFMAREGATLFQKHGFGATP